jgi:hypothetical protein
LGLGSAGLRSEEGRRRAERGLGFQPTLASGCCELIFRYQSEPLWKYRQVGELQWAGWPTVIFEIRFTSTLFDFNSQALARNTLTGYGIFVDLPCSYILHNVGGTLSFVNYMKLLYIRYHSTPLLSLSNRDLPHCKWFLIDFPPPRGFCPPKDTCNSLIDSFFCCLCTSLYAKAKLPTETIRW